MGYLNISPKTIWIDLDHSPHVPFFVPIIQELRDRGYRIILTARDCAQTCALADLHRLDYKRVGRHFGKNKLMKVAGFLIRSLQLVPTFIREMPCLAVSHGSRSQILSASIMRIPSITIVDYEHTQWIPAFHPTWTFIPEVLSPDNFKVKNVKFHRYPGIKEDVYVPKFKPNGKSLTELGADQNKILITIRPPAEEAHYHNPESDLLYRAAVEFLCKNPDTQLIIVPRTEKQKEAIKSTWNELIKNNKVIVPQGVVNGLDLIWHSDLVISGGGTMNREAAALNVPVYSIFRGKIGAVDRYLAANNRLFLLESVSDVQNKIVVARRSKEPCSVNMNSKTLKHIADSISSVAQNKFDRLIDK